MYQPNLKSVDLPSPEIIGGSQNISWFRPNFKKKVKRTILLQSAGGVLKLLISLSMAMSP